MGFVRRFIKNDAAQQDPPQIYNWRVTVLCTIVCFGGMAFGFNLLPAFKTKFEQTKSQQQTGRRTLFPSSRPVHSLALLLAVRFLTSSAGRRIS